MKTPPSFQNHLPRCVIFGRDRSLALDTICRDQGWGRAFIVSDEGVARAGLLEKVSESLIKSGGLADTFTAVPAEPPIEVVDLIAQRIIASGADVVVGLGGGSVMDAAKVAALCARHARAAVDFIGIGKAGGRGLPTVLIPTTAGTGSETTFVAILTDTAAGTKTGVVDPRILPDIAIVDPALTDGLPPHVTAATGMDALVHALEGFISKNATPLGRSVALGAARHIGHSIEVVCADPKNTAARDGMAVGSHLAGMAFANGSCCAVHGLAMPLGGRYHIPHGVIIGCFAGELMRHNAPVCAADFAEFSQALGWGALPPDAFADRLDALAESIGLRALLNQTAVPREDIGQLAEDALRVDRLMDPNPRELRVDDAIGIYLKVLRVVS